MSNIAILTWERWINPESCTPKREITLANLKEKQWHGNTIELKQLKSLFGQQFLNFLLTISVVQYPHNFLFSDFDGCISVFEVDGSPLSLWNSTTDRFKIERSSKAGNVGCSQLCSANPCGANHDCTPDGEGVSCSAVKSPQEEESLSIGVIVVIAFFGVLLIVIGIIFVIFRIRRQKNQQGGSDHNRNTKYQGNGHLNKSYTNNSPHSAQDSGYGEADYNTRNNAPYNNGVPDLINQPRRSPLPYHIDGGTVIIENGDMQLNSLNDDMPEHYDIDNASSIAPSDIDIVTHYRDFRKGFKNDLNYHHQRPHKHSTSSRTSRESPSSSQNWHNQSNSPPPYGALKQQTASHMRHSHANKLEVPSVNINPARNSPSYLGVRNSPINQLSRQSPQVRASPLTHSNVHVQHSRTDSEHSLASHHSRSSTSSSVPRTALPNGHVHGRHHKDYFRPNSRQKGLTKEDVDKLNARPQMPSPVSMVEAVSSSSEGQRQRNKHLHPDQMMLVPPDSSSDDSANDSFTCSEFEYENDRGSRGDFDPSAMIFRNFPKLIMRMTIHD